MNARQKAKQLKKELELMKKAPMPVVRIYNTNVKTLQVGQTVDTGYLNELSADVDCHATYIHRELVHQLAEQIINEVRFKQYPSRIPYHTDIVGEITIVTEGRD